MACPQSEKVASFLDEQLSVAETKQFEAHLGTCTTCAAELEETRDLFASIKAGGELSLDDAAFMEGVMDAIETPARGGRRRVYYALAAAVALLVLLPLVLLNAPAPSDPGVFTPRGKPDQTLKSLVDAIPFVVNGDTILPLDEKTLLTADDGLTFQYTNQSEEPVYFMAFAIDVQRDIHWFYPAYLTESSDPEAYLLSRNSRDRLMPDIVQAEDVPPGVLTIMVVLSTTKRTVKRVERALSREPERSVDTLFSNDDIIKKWTIPYQ